MARLIDLSHPLAPGQASFPSDPELSILAHNTIARIGYNITQLCMSTHQGTHLDAPYHFFDEGTEIILVEGLAHLEALPERFTLAAFPLPIQGRDGSPIRAVAIVQE